MPGARFHRDAVMALLIAAIFVFAIGYTVFSATTIDSNVNTGGTLTVSGVSTLTGAVYASSTVQATGNYIAYASLGIGTTSPGTALAVQTAAGLIGGPLTVFGELRAPYIYATTTTSNVFFGNIGYATATPGTALAIQTGAGLIGGALTVFGEVRAPYFYATSTTANIFSGNIGVATATPGTALSIVGAGAVTDSLSAKIFKATSTTETSIFPIASTTSFSVGNLFNIAGAGTSTVSGGLTVVGSSGSFGVATATPAAVVGITGNQTLLASGGTTTISLDTTSTSQGGCLELKAGVAAEGTRWVRIYVGGHGATTSDGAVLPAIVLGSGGQGLLVIEEGRCR